MMYECNTCKREIVAPSAVASYENNYYHPECLTCSVCKRSVSGKQFLKEKTGKLVCEECNAKTAPKCTKCNKIFAPGESYKKLTDSIFYHNECFKCCGPCKKPIAAEFYDMENNKFLCVDCYDQYGSDFEKSSDNDDTYNAPAPPVPTSVPQRRDNRDYDKVVSDLDVKLTLKDKNAEVLPAVLREKPAEGKQTNQPSSSRPEPANTSATPSKPASNEYCGKCGEKLTGSYTVYNEKKFHAKCFVCCQCNQEFKEKTFFKLNDNPLCRNCHTKNLSKCRKCGEPIQETVVTFKGGEYHDSCLTCNMCSKKLIGQSIYTDKQDKPYCVDCFTKKEAKTCAKCCKPIAPSQTNLVFEEKNYHKECFRCKDCKRIINSSESFYKSDDGDDGLICGECAK